jgi:GNAT superfamily N-acetyltransferase
VTIAPAATADLDAVVALETVAFADPWTRSAFDAALRERHSRFRVARSPDGALLGYIVAWFVLDEGEIANLAVVPAARRTGVARALLDTIIAEARASRIARVVLPQTGRRRDRATAGLVIERRVQRNRVARDVSVSRDPDLVVIVSDETMGHRQEES